MEHLLKWLYPGMKMKRWLFLFAFGVIIFSLGLALVFGYKYFDVISERIFLFAYKYYGSYNSGISTVIGLLLAIIGALSMLFAVQFIIRSIITVLVPNPTEAIVDMIFENRKLRRGANITVIGGGHGLSVLLRGLKMSTSNLSAIVTVADDGGSSGRLREDLGIIPPGDLRNCLVALADTEPLMEKLFQYRFEGESDLAGHSFGNLFIAAMHEVTGDMEKALQESSKVLAVKGRVIPASKEYIRLDAVMTDGTIVKGESQIPEARKKIKRVKLFPKVVSPVPSAIEAIESADAIILGPGSLYTSVMPNLLVDGIADAIRKSKAVKIYICNVMTQPGETDHYSVSEHAKAIIEHAGAGIIDYVLVNSTPISDKIKEHYASEDAYPVEIDEKNIHALGLGFVQADIINETNVIRHDPMKLANAVMKMIDDLNDKK